MVTTQKQFQISFKVSKQRRITYIYIIVINKVLFYVSSTYIFINFLSFKQPKKVGRADITPLYRRELWELAAEALLVYTIYIVH